MDIFDLPYPPGALGFAAGVALGYVVGALWLLWTVRQAKQAVRAARVELARLSARARSLEAHLARILGDERIVARLGEGRVRIIAVDRRRKRGE